MKKVAFVGPSTPSGLDGMQGIEFRRPAIAGDVFAAVAEGFELIGLIDGEFEGCRSVLHDEILYALSTGVQVWGAASMGALRAAECAPFGMQGFGRIYEMYRSREIEDEHEVALVYGPPELGAVPISVPFIDIRLNIRSALEKDLISSSDAENLMRHAQGFFYKDLTYKCISNRLPSDLRSAWQAVLSNGLTEYKLLDAAELLIAMKGASGPNDAEREPEFLFNETWFWKANRREFERKALRHNAVDARVLDELRLSPIKYDAYRTRAALRCALEGSVIPDPMMTVPDDLVEDLRQALGLISKISFADWLHDNFTVPDQIEQYLGSDYITAMTCSDFGWRIEKEILNDLRAENVYTHYLKRANEKQCRLQEIKSENLAQDDCTKDLSKLIEWLCKKHGIEHDFDDPEGIANSIGLDNIEAVRELIYNEYLFVTPKSD